MAIQLSHNQTEVEGMHDSVVVVCRIVKGLNAEDGMGTYERLRRILYSRAEKRKLGKCEDEMVSFVGEWANVVNLIMLI